MGTKVRIRPAVIADAKRRLQKLPPKDAAKSVTESVRVLSQDLEDALKRGYSRKEIRDILIDAGIPVSFDHLRMVLGSDRGRNADSMNADDDVVKLAEDDTAETVSAVTLEEETPVTV